MLDHIIETFDQKKMLSEKKKEAWKVKASSIAIRTRNYIRDIVDNLQLEPNPEKPVIALSIGDPTTYGNLSACLETVTSVLEICKHGSYNGYGPSVGFEEARQAVADYLSHDGAEFTSKDIILCSGCSSALEMCITVLCDPLKNHNILVPRPGFPIYRTLAESIGVSVKYYDLIPDKNWNIDVVQLESQIDENTAAIVLNNPSNPCGSVYSAEHLKEILEVAYRYEIPVIADEIYEQIVFNDVSFVSTASLKTTVPILICGGLAKRFLVPGWRLGWIAIHDDLEAFSSEIRSGLVRLSQRTIGANTIIQGALPNILQNTPQSFYDFLIETLMENAQIAHDSLENVRGLVPYMPQGTMYMMVEIELEKYFPQFDSGLKFAEKLMEEESVFCLPGECFEIPGFMRIILTVPQDLMKEACQRIAEFCNRNSVFRN